ncbi:MAG: galactokinase family protein [Clostridia bacterium]
MNFSHYQNIFVDLYGEDAAVQPGRYDALLTTFAEDFGLRDAIRLFSAPGRSEIGGNHTDHQHGHVLACAVTLDMIAAVSARTDGKICIHSPGYPAVNIQIGALNPRENEKNTSVALVRGIAANLQLCGYRIGGFDACIATNVPKGSGLSSSAAYSILIATIFSNLYNSGSIPPLAQALSSQYAENLYFGKPSGLMDQLACVSGGFVAIDFADVEHPLIEKINCDLAALGYAICIVNAGGSHANLTSEYAAVPAEMRSVAKLFGKEHLREVNESDFYERMSEFRNLISDRALLRAMHFFSENKRVQQQAAALRSQDMAAFARLMIESGRSSFMQLQNVCPVNVTERSIALALAVTERLLDGAGAWRIHGGGFAGTIQALVPLDRMDMYIRQMKRLFGSECCYRLSVRSVGGTEILPQA